MKFKYKTLWHAHWTTFVIPRRTHLTGSEICCPLFMLSTLYLNKKTLFRSKFNGIDFTFRSGIKLRGVTWGWVTDRFPKIKSGSLIEMLKNGVIGEKFSCGAFGAAKNVQNRQFFAQKWAIPSYRFWSPPGVKIRGARGALPPILALWGKPVPPIFWNWGQDFWGEAPKIRRRSRRIRKFLGKISKKVA